MNAEQQEQVENQVKHELEAYEQSQTELANLETELNNNPQFKQFLQARKKFAEMEAEVWGKVEQVMIDNNIKTIKTDTMTLSIAQRISFDIDPDQLPDAYFKRVPDNTKIAGQFKLHGEPVVGTSPKYKQYLVKRIKEQQ